MQQPAKIHQLRPQQPAAPTKPSLAAQRAHRVHRRRLVILLATFALVVAVGVGAFIHTQRAIAHSRTTVASAQHTLKKTKATKAALKIQINQLNDEDYLMKLVREKYLVSKKGETVFALPGLAASPTTTSTDK